MSNRKPYRVAIIGTGGIANSHMDALRAAGDRVEVVAGMDIDAERAAAFCAKHQIPTPYSNLDEMLTVVKPDLVHICTPPNSHTDLAIQALEAGAWVNCEKPLCSSIADLDRLDEAEKRTGRYINTVFQWRAGSMAQHLKRLMQENALGKILVGTCLTVWYRDHAYYQVPWRGKWATELGGPTMGHGIHLTDLFLWLMGEWSEVRAMMGTLDRAMEVEDVSMALVRFENGAMGSITNSVLSPRQETYLRLDFQQATVELSGLYSAANSNWRISLIDGATDETPRQRWEQVPADVRGDHKAQLALVLDSMDRGERPLVSGNEARRIIEFSASLYKSAMTGQPVARGSIKAGDPFYYAMNGKPSV